MVWLKIKGYENEYQISNRGEIRRIDLHSNPRPVKSCLAVNKKRYVTLWKNGIRRNFMLHNLYAETFQVSVKTAMQIVYEQYEGNVTAKDRVRSWLLEKIQSCEAESTELDSMHDEILYLKSFLRQISES